MLEHLPRVSAAAFVLGHGAKDVAERLRDDDALLKAGQSFSWVALHTPKSRTPEALEIAKYLTPASCLSNNIKRMLYESFIARLQQNLNGNGIYGTQRESIAASIHLKERKKSAELSSEEYLTALKVLLHLKHNEIINLDTPADGIIELLTNMTQNNCKSFYDKEELSKTTSPRCEIPKPPTIPRKRLCYICRLALTVPHPTQPSMCVPCGAFNLASSQISAQPNLVLPARFTALVTGARINLGYHTALRLLRCGASVLATTRYPRDAAVRYAQESDFPVWRDRLKVLGADFRCAADVFALVKETRRSLRSWNGTKRLHLLVNNAAQTLTDSVRKEERAIEREINMLEAADKSGICILGTYRARVRGGGLLMALGGVEKERGLNEGVPMNSNATFATDKMSVDHTDVVAQDTGVYKKSSWVQSLSEIPYEDVISAHSVNTFVPLILCREFLPLMGAARGSPKVVCDGPENTKPEGYIINVSSREGIFEDRSNSAGKTGKHVHTNMSKAALNMITETEAASAWHSRRVAMNTVDPGYMSAAPEYEDSFGGQRPIGWEDGAGRVLWPIAIGEREGKAVWGRFLKHYGAIHVDPGAGRG